ncbi:trypsin-1-like [Saccostrea cucullata]|uniref:trypsin-1-like n=1 Tax=Saccostrea cuccullata TaxID=36930 RepID=UPI002ED3911F
MRLLILASALVIASAKPHAKLNVKNAPCGTPSGSPNGLTQYIVGGVEANVDAWPWQISLEYNGRHICGGTLIRNDAGDLVVVTAAHCVDGSLGNPSNLRIKVGEMRLSQNVGQRMAVQEVRKHRSYNSATINNDIAILTFTTQPTESSSVMPACMPTRDHGVNELAYVTGWGTTSEGGSTTDRLMEVSKPILSDTACASFLGSSYKSATMLCAGYEAGGADACQGDSGGPFVAQRGGVWELAGVVSWGYGCARPELPGVYADVWNYVNWVKANWST